MLFCTVKMQNEKLDFWIIASPSRFPKSTEGANPGVKPEVGVRPPSLHYEASHPPNSPPNDVKKTPDLSMARRL